METRKRKSSRIIIICLCMMFFLSGCTGLKPGVKELNPEETQIKENTDKATKMAESIVEKKAKEKHVGYSLSDDFINKYFNMSSFNELKARTIAGIAVTQNSAVLAENEYQLWKNIIANKQFNQYTTADLQQRQRELENILDSLASEKKQTLIEYLEQYGMDVETAHNFLNNQAEKYYQEKVNN